MSKRQMGVVKKLGEAGPAHRASLGTARGRLEALLPSGRVAVRIGGQTMPALIALDCTDAELLTSIELRRDVLVTFMDDEPAVPVIVGILREHIAANRERNQTVDRFITLDAVDGVLLRCGDASVRLRPDGHALRYAVRR